MERILKAGVAAAAWPRRRIDAATWVAGEQAAALVAEAAAAVAELRREAVAEAEVIRAEAAARGREEGLAGAAAAVLAAEAGRARALAEAEGEALALAVDLARRLLGRELALAPGAVRLAAGEALAAARGRRRVVLRLHPAGAAALAGEAGALAEAAGLPSVRLVADAALAPGDAVVETEAGVADARLEVRLAELRRALAAASQEGATQAGAAAPDLVTGGADGGWA